MRERGILFQTAMVRAILEGTKTQTRRVCPVQPVFDDGLSAGGVGDVPSFWHVVYPWGEGGHGIYNTAAEMRDEYDRLLLAHCRFGNKGDRLWVREAWRLDAPRAGDAHQLTEPRTGIEYRESCEYPDQYKWKPGIHLKRVHARILLEVTGVRIERAHEISEADALAEGVQTDGHSSAREEFRWLWEEINGRASWEANPLVWVISFKRL